MPEAIKPEFITTNPLRYVQLNQTEKIPKSLILLKNLIFFLSINLSHYSKHMIEIRKKFDYPNKLKNMIFHFLIFTPYFRQGSIDPLQIG